MARGGHNVKLAKKSSTDNPSPTLRVLGIAAMATKATRTSSDKRSSMSIPTPSFLSRNSSEKKLAGPVSSPLASSVCDSSQQQDVIAGTQTNTTELPVNTGPTAMDADAKSSLPSGAEDPMPSTTSEVQPAQPTAEADIYDETLDRFENLTLDESQSRPSSVYSREPSSIFSSDSASIYSSASSISSSGASVYSFETCGTETSTAELGAGGLQYQQRTGSVAVRPPLKRREAQDAASRERSTLARKAALFKNSKLSPQLPSFTTSLPTWSMVCRAAQASQDCYDSRALTRKGTYTAANPSKDIKAMIVDDQLIDNSRIIIVAIRGTHVRSLTDWVVNKDANPAMPVGFLDDEQNACHAGFLQVTKAMVSQVASQLQQHPACSEKPSLVFTGHSAGGAVAAMLYSHMLSTSVSSDLTALASQFSNINCVTFGAPPLSLTPLPKRDHQPGVFLAFANEGDPVLRLSNAAYVKSLAKLMTASPPSSTTPAASTVPTPVKVVRRSRGTGVIREVHAVAPPTPWEELPLWPTPAAPLTNAGDVILIRDKENGKAAASRVTADELSEVIFADLAQHGTEMYIRRVNELALAAMMGRDVA